MKNKAILITSAELCQNNVFDFVKEISKIHGYTGHLNLLAKDHINFYRRYNHGPQSLNELKAFVIEKVFNDPEAYLFESDYKNKNGILIKQVTPLKFLYEFVRQQDLGEVCYAAGQDEPLSHNFLDIKVECRPSLVTSKPVLMRDSLEKLILN